MPLWRAAVLCAPLARRPEYETCRVLNPDWMWLDPTYVLLASVYGVKPPKDKKPAKSGVHQATSGAASLESLDVLLTRPRKPVS